MAFADRAELERLDRLARALGGERASAEFRPCFAHLRRELKPHTAVYLFTTEELVQAFAAQRDTP